MSKTASRAWFEVSDGEADLPSASPSESDGSARQPVVRRGLVGLEGCRSGEGRGRPDPPAPQASNAFVAAIALAIWLGVQTVLGAPPVWGAGKFSAAAPSPGPQPHVFEPGVTVHVSGAVRRPGIYRLAPGSRIADAIQAAGGAVRGAPVADLDLASRVADGESVRVPAAGERLDGSGDQPIVSIPGSFDPRLAHSTGTSRVRRARISLRAGRTVRHTAPRGRSHGARTKGAASGQGARVCLNRASAAELQRLPGVGPGLAARIVAYRSRAGRFERIEELREVQGIGEKRLARIAPLVDLR